MHKVYSIYLNRSQKKARSSNVTRNTGDFFFFFKGGRWGQNENKQRNKEESVTKTKHHPQKIKEGKINHPRDIASSKSGGNRDHWINQLIDIISSCFRRARNNKSGVCWQAPQGASQYQYERMETLDWRAEIQGSGWKCEVQGMGLICEIQGLKFKVRAHLWNSTFEVWNSRFKIWCSFVRFSFQGIGLICEIQLSRYEMQGMVDSRYEMQGLFVRFNFQGLKFKV